MGKRTYWLAAGVLSLPMVLGGCGDGAPAGTETTTPSAHPTTEASKAESAPATTKADSKPAANHAGGLPVAKLGQPHEDRGGSMTVTGFSCGATELKHAKENKAWYDDTEGNEPQTITLKAKPGMMFCLVKGTYEVTGKKPKVGWTDFDNLVTADGTEFAADRASEDATDYLNQRLSGCSPNTCDTLNPGTVLKQIIKVYQVPKGTKPVGVNWPMETMVSGPSVQFALSHAAGEKTSAPAPDGAVPTLEGPATATVPKIEVQDQIVSAIERAGGTASDADCPHALPGQVDAEMVCSVVLNGEKLDVKVKVTRVSGGQAFFNVLPADEK